MKRGQAAVTTDGTVAAAVLFWRFQKRLQMTVVVKAEFALVHGGDASHVGPGAIVADETGQTPADLVPYRSRCDVTFVGHAFAPDGRPAPASSVRLGLAREATLLDKSLHVFGDRAGGAPALFSRMPLTYDRALGGPGLANPVGSHRPNVVDPRDGTRPGGFGPIPRSWPERATRLAPGQAVALDAPLPELPDATRWDYFQAAPPDQQIDYLRGGEWLVLDGLHPQLARLQTRLPSASAVARLGGPTEVPLRLACDTLAIDGDRQVLAMVWRGLYEVVGGKSAIPSLRVAASLGVGQAKAVGAGKPSISTLSLNLGEQAEAAAKPLAPFPVAPAGAHPTPASPTLAPWLSRGAPPPAPSSDTFLTTLPLDQVVMSPFACVPEIDASAESPSASPFASDRDPEVSALEAKLRAVGAGSDDLATLLGALKPVKN